MNGYVATHRSSAGSAASNPQDDVGDVRVVWRRVDPRLDRVHLDREVVAEQLDEVVRTDVVRRVDAPRLHVLAVLVVKVVVDGEQQARRGTPCRAMLRTAASPAALGSAGYCIETRSNEPGRER